MPFRCYLISLLTDDIIRLRYVEINGQLRKILMVVKMRGGAHSSDIRDYQIDWAGFVTGGRLRDYAPQAVDAQLSAPA